MPAPRQNSYDPALSQQVSRIRFTLGDTDPDAALLDSRTILAMLAQFATDDAGNPVLPAAQERWATLELARGLVTRYAQDPVVVTNEGQTTNYTSRLAGWQAVVARLEAQGTATAGVVTRRATRGPSTCVGEFG